MRKVPDPGFHRKLMKRREIPGDFRYLSFSCEHELPFFSNPKIADVFVAALLEARTKFLFELFAWVIMPEHVHLLMRSSTQATVETILTFVKNCTAQRVIHRWRRLNAPILPRITKRNGQIRFWLKGGGWDDNLEDLNEVSRKVRYTHLNPVRRGLVRCAEDYRYSSVHWWMGTRKGEVACDPLPGYGWENWKGYV